MAAGVDWERLGAAVRFYGQVGFKETEVPWAAPPSVTAITCADRGRIIAAAPLGDMVGSAEQSFLSLDLSGCLGRGSFVACTPCFRNEPVVSETHRKTFMKVELYRNDDPPSSAVDEVIQAAMVFFTRQPGTCGRLGLVRTDEGWDITLNGIEIGSYGIRSHGNLRWIYGTGLAEPRFTVALGRS